MNRPSHLPTRPHSTFVTVLAWFGVIGAGSMLVVALLQSMMLFAFFPSGALDQMRATLPPSLPASVRFLLENFVYMIGAMAALAALLLWVSLALLKRKAWARIMYVALLVLSIVWMVAAIPAQNAMLYDMRRPWGEALPYEVETTLLVFRVITIGVTLVFVAIHAWLAYKLCTKEIRREFV